MAEAFGFQRLVGAEIETALEHVAELRIRVFREWPYLYDGELTYEQAYLRTYVRSAQAVCILARDGQQVIGAATGIPLVDETDEIIEPLRRAGFPLEQIFYFGESVLLPQFRGRGIGVRFFEEREAHAAAHGFSTVVFCAVERPSGHPRRPPDYRPLDTFWRNRGYAPEPKPRAWFPWRDLDDHEETLKPLGYWSRQLRALPSDRC